MSRQIFNDGIYGTWDDGIQSKDCIGLLEEFSLQYTNPSDLLRFYITENFYDTLFFNENGLIVGNFAGGTIKGDLYVNGNFIGNYSFYIYPTLNSHIIRGIKNRFKKIVPTKEQDTEYLENINNALDFFDLPLTEQVTYKFNKSVNPTPKRVVILLRKK
jgi:hypothetical protein